MKEIKRSITRFSHSSHTTMTFYQTTTPPDSHCAYVGPAVLGHVRKRNVVHPLYTQTRKNVTRIRATRPQSEHLWLRVCAP